MAGIIDAIRRLFGGRRPGAERSRPLLEGLDLEPAAAPEPDEAPVEHLSDHLHTLFKDRATVSVGRIQVLNLTRIRARLGEEWPTHAAKVHAVVHEVFADRLKATDVHTRMDESAYAIVFASLSGPEARAKAAAIAEEIATRLFGREAAARYVDVRDADAGGPG